MSTIKVHPKAQEDLLNAQQYFLDFFEDIGDTNKGLEWAASFQSEVEAAYRRIEEDPYCYPICQLFPFNQLKNCDIRRFRVLWHIGFYRVRAGVAEVIRVVSDKSDLSKVLEG